MATKTIPQLPAAAAALTTMKFEVDDSGTSENLTLAQIISLLNTIYPFAPSATVVLASVALTNQSASIAPTVLFHTVASGIYRLTGEVLITTGGPATGNLTARSTWTDDIGAFTNEMIGTGLNNATATARISIPDYLGRLNFNGAAVYPVFYAVAGTDISYSTTYAGGTGNAMRYALRLVLEQVM